MGLAQLPPEIVALIIHHLGSYFFYKDVGRLTVCKAWYLSAIKQFFTEVKLSRSTLRRLLSSEYSNRTLASVKDNMETLYLELRGLHKEINRGSDGSSDNYTEIWPEHLIEDFAQLVVAARQSGRLRAIRVGGLLEYLPEHRIPSHFFVYQIRDLLLSTQNLTVIDLDLRGGNLRRYRCPELDDQFGSTISHHLGTLKRLQLSVNYFPRDGIKWPPNVADLRPGVVLFRLTVKHVSYDGSTRQDTTTAQSFERCNDEEATENLHKPRSEDIKHRIKALVKVMASPRLVRVLICNVPAKQIPNLTVLKGEIQENGEYRKLKDVIPLEDNGDTDPEWEGP